MTTIASAAPTATSPVPAPSDGPARRGPARGNAVGQARWIPYAFLIPGLAFLGVFFAWPAFTAIQLAFYRYDVVSPPEFIGLDNFATAFTSPDFWQALRNSALFLLMYLPLVVFLPLLLAVLVNAKIRAVSTFRLLYYLPVVTPMVAIAIAWSYVFHPRGGLNWALLELGVVDEPIQFLLDSTWALPAVVAVEVWHGLGYFMVIYLAGLQAIPQDLYAAAALDGAGWWRQLTSITMPLIRPYFAVCLVLGGVFSMQAFASIYVLTGGGPQGGSSTLGFYIWSEAFQRFNFGYASAVGLILWALLLTFAAVSHRLSRGDAA
ncbi:carbohydrate ABC transporter permease [Jiangella rhizosphaerae]|uniref:Sugar ABC transporter permease n=1 Tax=Jiangella rhizosphaerae TaxID=2293569 RepID=A0A418KM25_9ACTN|nr:sugar ABC transporter permease [Jiangella rhizosphaerae]RIQ18989.1 sugar ABC transporter permease [Jiangella rhizosphaerae]